MLCLRYVGLLLPLITGIFALDQETSNSNVDQRNTMVTAIRTVNTAEAQYFSKIGHYGSIKDLRSSGDLNQAQAMFSNSVDMSSSDQPLPGLELRVTTSDDKKRYQLSVTKEAKPFIIGFFSNERGLIYEGHPLQ